jgi:hypothetical protein
VRAAHPAVVAALRREITVLADLDHPGVVRVVDPGGDAGAPWHAMSIVEAPS